MNNRSSRDEINPYGYATNEWYEFEAKKAGFRTPQAYMMELRRNAPRCPHCGTPQGFAFGTGDCGCSDDFL